MFRSLFSITRQKPLTPKSENGSIEKTELFPTVDPAVDGPDCDKECADCTIEFPSRFKVNSDRELYGSIKPFVKHVLVATGKTDWVPKVEDEEGSLMEGFKKGSFKPKTGVRLVPIISILGFPFPPLFTTGSYLVKRKPVSYSENDGFGIELVN